MLARALLFCSLVKILGLVQWGRRELDITTSVDEADRINHPACGFEGGYFRFVASGQVAFRDPGMLPDRVGPSSMMAYSWTHVLSFCWPDLNLIAGARLRRLVLGDQA